MLQLDAQTGSAQQEARVGENIQVLATPGLWGPEVADASSI